jgi:1-acyl-sn-glycerol-3-phosphate acyltransferase
MIKLILDLCCYITFDLRGWKFSNQAADVKKYIILAVPHTSNWDTYYALICFHRMKVPVKFAIKSNWLVFPFKQLLTPLGAIGVNRNKQSTDKFSFVDACAELFNNSTELVMTITPEGTRGRNDKWKTGFYNIATKANVPMAVAVCDYVNKQITIHPPVFSTGNYVADLKKLSSVINPAMAKFPNKFAFDASVTQENK